MIKVITTQAMAVLFLEVTWASRRMGSDEEQILDTRGGSKIRYIEGADTDMRGEGHWWQQGSVLSNGKKEVTVKWNVDYCKNNTFLI